MSDRIDAAEAQRCGLIQSVVAHEQLCERVRLRTPVAVTSSPAAIAETKRLLYRHLGTGYVEALQEADAVQ
jgi:enoyl-CoA hydratase/carnithine racemase